MLNLLIKIRPTMSNAIRLFHNTNNCTSYSITDYHFIIIYRIFGQHLHFRYRLFSNSIVFLFAFNIQMNHNANVACVQKYLLHAYANLFLFLIKKSQNARKLYVTSDIWNRHTKATQMLTEQTESLFNGAIASFERNLWKHDYLISWTSVYDSIFDKSASE